MKLTQEQIDEIKLLYGDDFNAANKVIETLRSKKGVVKKLFSKDSEGKTYIRWTVEEFEQLLTNPNGKKRELTTDTQHLIKIQKLFREIKTVVKKINRTSTFDSINYEIGFLNDAIKRRYYSILDMEIKTTNEEIQILQDRLKRLEADKIQEKN